MEKVILETILGKSELKQSYLGYSFLVWNITNRKALNLLIKNGFTQCPNPGYLQKDGIYVNKKTRYKQYFMFQI